MIFLPPPPPEPPCLNGRHGPSHTCELVQMDVNAPRIMPTYPDFEALYGVSGQVTLRVQVDASGNARKVDVDRSTGSAVLDEAAMRAVTQWKFRPSRFDGKPTSGEARVPVIFSPNKMNVPQSWPAGYEHPRYNVVPLGSNFASVDDLLTDVMQRSTSSAPARSSVTTYLIRSRQGEILERWTFTDLHTHRAMAIRYVFATADGQPTVNVAALCDDRITCESRVPALIQGPVYARSNAGSEL